MTSYGPSAYIGTSTSAVPPSCPCGSGPQNLEMVRGDTAVFSILVYTTAGPLNISGGTLAFNAASTLPIASLAPVPVLTVPTGGQATVTVSSTGLANVTWSFGYQLVFTDLNGVVTTVAYGTLKIFPNQ